MSTLLDLVSGGLAPAVLAGLLAISFAASFITVTMGIGGGVLLLAVMASLLPPAALIPVHGLIQLGSNGARAVVLFRHIHWPPVAAFTVGSLAGVILGGLLVVDLPPPAIRIGVGSFVIWTILSKPPAWMSRFPALTGGVSSFLTMFFGATGPFVATLTKSLKLPRQDHVATHGTFMTLQHGLKVVTFGFLGFAFAPWVGFIVLMILAGLAGTLSGRFLLEKMSDHGFKRALDIVLTILALRLIWDGVSTLLG